MQDCSPNCAFSNPSSPYGLVMLPAGDAAAPQQQQQQQQSAQAPPGPGSSSSSSSSSSSGGGMAPTYQLGRQEVVLLAGCTPPEGASSYFAATPYIYSTWNNASSKWVHRHMTGAARRR